MKRTINSTHMQDGDTIKRTYCVDNETVDALFDIVEMIDSEVEGLPDSEEESVAGEALLRVRELVTDMAFSRAEKAERVSR